MYLPLVRRPDNAGSQTLHVAAEGADDADAYNTNQNKFDQVNYKSNHVILKLQITQCNYKTTIQPGLIKLSNYKPKAIILYINRREEIPGILAVVRIYARKLSGRNPNGSTLIGKPKALGFWGSRY